MGLFNRKSKHSPSAKTKNDPPKNAPEIVSIPLPVGVRLTGFFMNYSGMCRGNNYIYRETESGAFMKITDKDPDELSEIDESLDEDARHWFNRAETVSDEEHASCVRLADEAPRLALESAIEKAGALGWDGMRLSRSLPSGVMDGDYGIVLYLELSDGTAVEMRGSNASPDGWNDFRAAAEKVFHENEDYSRYVARDFDSAPCGYLSFSCKENGLSVQLLFNRSIEVLRLDDKQGKLGEPADISIRKDSEDPRPYERFLGVYKKHGMEKLNGYNGGGVFNSGFETTLSFEDRREYRAAGKELPEGFSDFLRDLALEIKRYYNEIGQ